jgi:hypothetical protein
MGNSTKIQSTSNITRAAVPAGAEGALPAVAPKPKGGPVKEGTVNAPENSNARRNYFESKMEYKGKIK